jgi:hypothetical protein
MHVYNMVHVDAISLFSLSLYMWVDYGNHRVHRLSCVLISHLSSVIRTFECVNIMLVVIHL